MCRFFTFLVTLNQPKKVEPVHPRRPPHDADDVRHVLLFTPPFLHGDLRLGGLTHSCSSARACNGHGGHDVYVGRGRTANVLPLGALFLRNKY